MTTLYRADDRNLLISVLSGAVDAGTSDIQEVASQVEAGKVRILAALTTQRIPGYENIPTAQEQGTDVVVNQFRGIVEEVRTEGLLAVVRLRIGGQLLTAVITRDAVDELRLRRGDPAVAIVKSTEVMIAREAEPGPRPAAARARRKTPSRRR